MKVNIKEWRTRTTEELNKIHRDSCLKMQDLNFKSASKQLKNVREIRKTKKDIARALTLLREKQLIKK